jgi:hypothetical protein
MIVKGIIKTIDYNGNMCTVRLPLFESSSKSGEVILPATIAIQPGLINSYKEEDVVLISFENNKIETPVVIGKLYLGATAESKESRGNINVTGLTVSTKASIPLTTELTFKGDTTSVVDVDGGLTTYKTLADIVRALQKVEVQFNTTSRDISNQIKEIKVTYLKTNKSPLDFEPTAEDPAWHKVMPVSQDGHFI